MPNYTVELSMPVTDIHNFQVEVEADSAEEAAKLALAYVAADPAEFFTRTTDGVYDADVLEVDDVKED